MTASRPSVGSPQDAKNPVQEPFRNITQQHAQGGIAKETYTSNEGKAIKILVYGAVNALMGIPVLYGYATIIFRHPMYVPFMPALTKLVLFSSMVHQILFSLLSTLSFAIGQVQDAGLIFLCRITTDVAVIMLNNGFAPEETVATALAATALGTAGLGLCLVAVGKMHLGRFVTYLPMPVIGGYLAYIGLFCLEAGLGLCSGKDIRGVSTWGTLFNFRDLLLCTPCVVLGLLLSWVSRRFEHYSVLPICMLVVPALFYLGLVVFGISMQDARNIGLMGQTDNPAELSWSFALFQWELVQWSVLSSQLGVWVGMVFVVAFSSSLDVAAIEIDMGEPLDSNKELETVGWSNVVSGLTGGFTGSYIFSQTLFTRRTGTNSRLIGWVVSASELALCLITADPLAYVPLAFFASTLTFIAVELCVEWLWEIREKVLPQEYFVLVCTFVGIQVVGLNEGLLVGAGCSVLSFVVSYASEQRNNLQRVWKRGRTMRPATQRCILQDYREKVVCVELRGELFFGSSLQVFERVRGMLDLSNGKGLKGAGPAACGNGSRAVTHNMTTPGEGIGPVLGRAVNVLGKALQGKKNRARGRSCSSGNSSPRGIWSPAHGRLRASVGGTSGNPVAIRITTPNRMREMGEGEPYCSSRPTYRRSFDNGVVGDGEVSPFLTPGHVGAHEMRSHYSLDFIDGRRRCTSEVWENQELVLGNVERGGQWIRDSDGVVASGLSNSLTISGSVVGGGTAKREHGGVGLMETDKGRGSTGGEQGGSNDVGEGGHEEIRVEKVKVADVEPLRGSSIGDMCVIPTFLILDCSRVTNIDASSARACFLPLQRVSEQSSTCIAYAGLTHKMETLLRAHKALDGDKIATFPTIYAAVEFCETQLIWAVTQAKTTVKQGNGNATSQGRGIRGDGERGPWSFGLFNQMDSCRSIPVSSVKDVLLQVLEVSGIDAPFTVDCIARYCVEEKYDPGSVIFTPGDTADRFFIIAEGKVVIESLHDHRPVNERSLSPTTIQRPRSESLARAGGQVVLKPSAIFGYVDHQLDQPRTHFAIAEEHCRLCIFTKQNLERMQVEDPKMLWIVERSLLKHLSLELSSFPI